MPKGGRMESVIIFLMGAVLAAALIGLKGGKRK